MTPQIRNWQTQPPSGGWSVVMNIKGQTFRFSGLPHGIVRQAAEAQKRNGEYKGDKPIWDWLNNEWCRRDPDRCLSKSFKVGNSSEGFLDGVKSYLRAMSTAVKNGMKPVPQEVAEERAKICASCPSNTNVSSCGVCVATVRTLSRTVTKGRTTKMDSRLKQCGVCKCDLKTKVHFPVDKGDTHNYPSHCWVRKELEDE